VHPPGRGVLRWSRAGLLVALTVLTSLGGHALAGGTVRVSTPMVLGVLALGAMCVAAADTRRSAREIFGVVLLAQPVLHLLAGMGGHPHAHAGDLGAAVAPAMTPALAGPSPATAVMVAAHVAAAGVLSVLLAAADRVLWALAGLRVRVPVPVVVAGPPPCRPLPLRHDDACVPLRSALRCAPRLRRGPPVVAVAP
jgi:hypothetical protein